MAFQMATVAAVAVILTLMTAATLGDAGEQELINLIDRLRSQIVHEKETKQHFQSLHDNVHEVRYRLETESRRIGKNKKNQLRTATPVPITADQQQAFENAVNDARRSQNAADMQMIRWNSNLAALAQQWSDQCLFSHGAPLFDYEDVGFYEVGQNNWVFKGTLDPKHVVDDWLTEKKYYDVDSGSCHGGGCSHYKQLAWSTTTDFGCAITSCGTIGSVQDGNFLVCYFGPAGNFVDEKAFIPATSVSGPCSKCHGGTFYCNNDLCDATCTQASSTCVCKASCQNCGTATADCQCTCNAGSIGVDCSNLCVDTQTYCKDDYEDLCYIPFVVEMCPHTCEVCTAGNPCSGTPGGAPSAGGSGTPSGSPSVGGSPASSSSGGSPAASAPGASPSSGSSSGPAPPPVDPSQNLDHGLTPAQKERFLYLFNKHRSEAGATNMNKLVWDDNLARIGQEWSDRCIFEHRSLSAPGGHGYVDPASVGFPTTTLGESIWAFSDNSQTVPDKAVDDWYHEKDYYTFSTATCEPGKDCGHYIALVWAYSTAMGCGFTKCASVQAPGATWSGGVMISCNFAGGADMDKQPFQVGQPCTECVSGSLYCTDNLCDSSCTSAGSGGVCACNAQCNHGSPAAHCSCHCSHGYMGGQCDAPCENLVPECDNDWAFTECNGPMLDMFGFGFMYDKIYRSCPKLCGRCSDADVKKAVTRSEKSSNHRSHHHQTHLSRDD